MRSSSAIPPKALKEEIKNKIKGKVAIVGIGNPLRGDDGFGPNLIESLKAAGARSELFDCGTAPENYIFPILSTSSDTIIFADTADLKESPGALKVLGIEEISRISFSTHNPSPRLFADLLRTGKDNINIFIIAVQPKRTTLGESLSDEVIAAVKFLTDTLKEILDEQHSSCN